MATPPHQSQASEPVIRVRNLVKKFGTVTAVDGLTLDIHHHQIFGFLGPNGAGKTTSISMICGLLPPTSGEILFDGQPGHRHNGSRTQLGICPQENIFWPKLTCLEQLAFMGRLYDLPAREARRRALDLLDMLGLTPKADVLAGKLSGGMKRRLNICLALIHDPDLLVLDEPEAGLDPQSRILVRNFIRSLAQRKTIILTTHNMDEADRLADRVAIIDQGKLLLLDSPAALKKSIGEGDILEIQIADDLSADQLESLREALKQSCEQLDYSAGTLIVKTRDLLTRMAAITREIEHNQLVIRSMTLRENTLEDVFIHLTGRKLRQ